MVLLSGKQEIQGQRDTSKKDEAPNIDEFLVRYPLKAVQNRIVSDQSA